MVCHLQIWSIETKQPRNVLVERYIPEGREKIEITRQIQYAKRAGKTSQESWQEGLPLQINMLWVHNFTWGSMFALTTLYPNKTIQEERASKCFGLERYIQGTLSLFLLINFMLYLKGWWWCTGGFSQTWLQAKYQSNILLYFRLHTWSMFKNLVIYLKIWNFIENLKKLVILALSIFNISFWLCIASQK
jgi:hypothetical protein